MSTTEETPALIDSTEEALEVLKPNVIARLNLYCVNTKHESDVLPQAILLSPSELRALELVIRVARKSITPKRRIEANVWGNIYGYEGSRRVKEFGTDAMDATAWVEYRDKGQ